jgi:tetratricopeptide (TPR) repeat protein
MSSSARIDELRKKFDENPRRYFAPLANEYRKAGDFEQAVFICQEYLPQQPGHMSGHIVYGQTLFDMGRDEEARAVFETALTLDPENLIALKHLGDIARQAGDLEGSRSWYQRVLEADPRNDEIMQILEAMGGLDTGTGTPSLGEHDRSPTAFATAHESAFEAPAEPELEANVPPPLPTTAALAEDTIEPLVLEQSVDAEMPVGGTEVIAAVETVVSSEVDAPSEADSHELLDLDDFAIGGSEVAIDTPVQFESESVAAPESLDLEAFGDEPAVEIHETSSAPASEPEVELATDLILGLTDDAPTPPPLEGVSSEFEVEPAAEGGEDLTRAIDQLEGLETFSMDVPVETPTAASESVEPPPAPDTFATETMAELYAQQGHFESAIEIYQQLIERSPEDTELRRRAEEVERQMRGEPAADVVESIDEAFVGSTAFVDIAAVDDAEEAASPVSSGPSIREFFREILEGHGAGVAASSLDEGVEETANIDSLDPGSIDLLFSESPTADADLSAAMSLAEAFGGQSESEDTDAIRGTPAHPAADELSLDHVFRSETPSKGSAAASAFSLDQFFSSGAASPEPSEAASDAALPRSGDDIAQFNAWLNGLKKT